MKKLLTLFLCLAANAATASGVVLDTIGGNYLNDYSHRLYDYCIGRASIFSLTENTEITSVELPLRLLQGGDPGELAIQIYSDFGVWSEGVYYSQPDQLIASTVREVDWNSEGYFKNFDFSDGVDLQAGQLYWMAVRLISHQENGDVLWEQNGVGDTGYFANLYQAANPAWYLTENGNPGGFRLMGSASAVPIPAAAWLFSSAIILVVGMKRKSA